MTRIKAWIDRLLKAYREEELVIKVPVVKYAKADESLPQRSAERRARAEELRRQSARIVSQAGA